MSAWLASSTMTTSNEFWAGATELRTWEIGMIHAGTAVCACAMADRAASLNRSACLPEPLPMLVMWSR